MFGTVKSQKPFLKWVGGKYKLLNKTLKSLPEEINNYHEVFLGGGSVLLAILSLQKANKIQINGNIYAYDLNSSLINCFNQVKTNPQLVINHLKKIIAEFTLITVNTLGQKGAPEDYATNHTRSREHYYYWMRKQFNELSKIGVKAASNFIFLNKTGFRGMYRESSDGNFNIPYGYKDKDKIPGILDEDCINNVSKLIQNVSFSCSNFSDTFTQLHPNDLAYLDPPYVPEDKKSFVGYTQDGFSLEDHKNLFKGIKEKKDIKFIMSNANVKLVTDSFKGYKIDYIEARRAINSKNPASTAKEVIIHN